MSSSTKTSQIEVHFKMIPPPNLNKETLIIWEGWSKMGLREVVRESATKGSHIDLAYLFLSQRKQLTLEITKQWFKDEVLEWVKELLKNKQVFRASHVLKNINLDPIMEIKNIMLDTPDNENRNFLSSHLEKNEQLDNDIKLHLELIKYMDREDDVLSDFKNACNQTISGNDNFNLSLRMLLDCDTERKAKLVAKLFLKYNDFSISSLIPAKSLWSTALEYNHRSFLKSWLQIQFATELSLDEEDELSLFLAELPITDLMLNEIDNVNVQKETKEFVYDTIAHFGIFNQEEVKDIEKIIIRTTKNALNENLEEILTKPTANLSFEQFKFLFKELCVQKGMFNVLDAVLPDEIFDNENIQTENDTNEDALMMLKSCKELSMNLNKRNNMKSNLELVNNYLKKRSKNISEDDQALLQLFLLRLKGFDLQKTLVAEQYFVILEALPTLNTILNKMLKNPEASGVTRYMLLEKHMEIDTERLFNYHFDNTIEERPNFKSHQLVSRYGRRKKLDYALFLLHCRPGKALTLAEIAKEELTIIESKVRRILIKNFQRADIVASCMYFLESLNIKTELLKIELAACKLLSEHELSPEEIRNLFLNVTGKTYEIVSLYEKYLFKNRRDFNESYTDFELVVKLATHYGCQLPATYLEQLATESSWVEFVFLIHKFEYPQEQVSKLVAKFSDSVLYDHLSHALAHDLVYEPKNVLMRDRDARRFFLARIGLLKHVDNDMMSSVTSQSSWGSNTSSSGLSDYISEIECSGDLHQRTNLLQVLIKCHNSNDPPKALLYAAQHYKYPLFAVLATTYEPDSVVTCWLTWLSVSCNIQVENCERLATVGSNVTDFLRRVLELGFYRTLKQSLCIFLFENPLKIFMEFLCDCRQLNFDIVRHQSDLKSFSKKLKQKRSNSYVPEIDHEMVYLNNKLWIENTSIALLAGTLNSFHDKPYPRVQLLKVLEELSLQQYFFHNLPDLSNIYNLFLYFYELKIGITLDFYKLFDANAYNDVIESCILKLMSEGEYDEALKIAQVENFLVDEVLIKKWGEDSLDQDSGRATEEYWLSCDQEFRHFSISPEKAVVFYQNETRIATDDLLRYKILMLAYSWTSSTSVNLMEKHQEVELEMWVVYLKLLSSTNPNFQVDSEKNKSYLEMKTDLETITKLYENELIPEETKKLDLVIDKLLNSGSIFQALRLQKIFKSYKNINLDIFKLCYSLAEGLTLPIQLTAQERLLIRKVKNNRSFSHRRKTVYSFRLSSSASRSPVASFGTPLEVEPKIQDTLSVLENLIDGLTSGQELGDRIVMTYRISINTDISYNNILTIDEPMGLLLNALNSTCANKIEVVHDFFCIYNWNKQQIADFLCEQLINAVNSCMKSKLDSYRMWDISLDQEIHLVLQLLPDACSILGNKLYSYSSALHKSLVITNEMPNMSEIIVVIELLILSHDCFTSDCNMEGISVILKKCQTLINLLLALKNWQLIVRLLTGVGRYTELNYVFHILRENDQFEYLLRKGSAKDIGLRVALLDYLKKYCPENRGLYEMVALYFSLYSEVAQIWESESQHSIKNLIAISKLEMINRKVNPDECIFVEFSNTEGTRICLHKAMDNYSHAAEYHLQGEKLAKAMNAARQAELIALQISLVKGLSTNATTSCILNLSTSQISTLISSLTFQQAIIVTEAYNYPTDWAVALFEHFIVKNDNKYFDQYLMTFNIADNLVHNLSRHYLSKNITSEHGIRNMKTVLQLLPSIHTKYRIASELGFSDLVEELLSSDKLNYLKDTVWKRGYRE